VKDLLDKAEQAMELARRAGAEAAEVYVIDAPQDTVLFRPTGAVVGLRTAVTVPHRGLGLAARWGRSVGFASTTDLTDRGLEVTAGEARAAAIPEDPPLPLTGPGPGPVTAVPGLVDHRLLEMNLPDLVEVGRDLVEEAQAAGAGVLGVTVSARCRRVAIANTLGVARSSLDTVVEAGAYAATPGGGFAFWSKASRTLDGLRAERVGATAARIAAEADNPRPVAAGRQTVVLKPQALLSLLGNSLAPALGADRALEGLGPFHGFGGIGDLVAAPVLSITDDATRPGGTGSRDFDAEGTPAGKTLVIREGRLVSLLYNNLTAARAGKGAPAGTVVSTANASRDHSERMRTFVEPSGHFGYRPGVAPSTLVVEAPRATYPTLADAGVDDGLLVVDVMGAFVIDPAVGDFSVTTTNAWAVERGGLTYPVKRAMLSGNVYSLLKQVEALVEEPDEVAGPFSLVTPSWVVTGVEVI